MDKFAAQPAENRAELFTETSARMGVSPRILEKNVWVCWTLRRVFSLLLCLSLIGLVSACYKADAIEARGKYKTPTVMFAFDIPLDVSAKASSEHLIIRLGGSWTETDLAKVDKNRGGRRKIGLGFSTTKPVAKASMSVCQPGVMGGAQMIEFGEAPTQSAIVSLTTSKLTKFEPIADFDISKLRNGNVVFKVNGVADISVICAIRLVYDGQTRAADVSRYFGVENGEIILTRAKLFRKYLRREKRKAPKGALEFHIDGYDFAANSALYGAVPTRLSY